MVVCIAEDRLSELVAVKLLIASLAKHCPDAAVQLFYPPAHDAFKAWLAAYPQVTLHTTPIQGAKGWDVKPVVLQQLLEAGHDDVWWMDSDIIVRADFRKSLGPMPADTVVATEEAIYGMYRDDGYRARGWGLPVGRPLPFTLNSCVVRLTQAHRDLVATWRRMLETPQYREAQRTPAHLKPFHLFGDQDVLTALMASRQFAHLPLKILMRGRDIIQYFGPAGYTLKERLGNILKPPALLHCQRDKPWKRAAAAPPVKKPMDYINYLRVEASPYTMAAARYAGVLGEPMPWLAARSKGGKFLRVLGLGHAALTGLPIAALYTAGRLAKAARRVNDRFDPAAAFAKLDPKWIVPSSETSA